VTDSTAAEPRATYTVAEIADLLGLSLGGTYTLIRARQAHLTSGLQRRRRRPWTAVPVRPPDEPSRR
jgi:hypothetical protein